MCSVENKNNTYKYSGAIHIHTKFSDGTGNVQSISKAAKKVGLYWIIITDHNSFDVEEGIYNGVYVIKGEEITPKNNNHYLALGINKLINPSEDIQHNVDSVRKHGGFGFAAHPDESRFRKNNIKPIVWENKNIIPDGVEIWNWFSTWGDNFNDKNIFNLAYSYIFRHKIITKPSNETLSWWDKLNNNSKKTIVPAIGGVDAHALKISKYLLPVTVFPYKTSFKTITNVITLNKPLDKSFNIAKNQILQALRQGNNIIINRKINNDIPNINISNKKCIVNCGENIELTDNTYLNVKMNKKSTIKVICDGREINSITASNCQIPISKVGTYRVEISQGKNGFAYTNPIKVLESSK